MVADTLQILEHFALVLFDSALHIHLFKLELEPFHFIMSVTTPAGVTLLANERVKTWQVLVFGHLLEVWLIIIDMTTLIVFLEWIGWRISMLTLIVIKKR